MLALRFAAGDSLLNDAASDRCVPLVPGRSYAVCRKPSKHEDAQSLFVTDPRASRTHMVFREQDGGWGGTCGAVHAPHPCASRGIALPVRGRASFHSLVTTAALADA